MLPHAPSASAPAAVAVYCGARPGHNPAFAAEARKFGRGLALRRLRLVYGSGDVGLMGEVARAAIAHGGEAIGVTTRRIMAVEKPAAGLAALIRTETLHERKAVMAANADAVVILPGGLGTLDELAETLSLHALAYRTDPIFLVNYRGYFDALFTFLDHMAAQGFVDKDYRRTFTALSGAEDTLGALDRLFGAGHSPAVRAARAVE